jgi:hypothetical protein
MALTRQTRQLSPLRKLMGDEIDSRSYRSPSGTYFNREATAGENKDAMAQYERDTAHSRRSAVSWEQLNEGLMSEEEWGSMMNDIRKAKGGRS